jgi:uncharacterized membrane protein
MQRKLTVIIGVFVLASITFIYANEVQTMDKPVSRFECRGNEPFWQLKINGDVAEYSRFTGTPETKAQTLSGKLKSLDYLRPSLSVWRGRSTDASGDVVAFIENKQCLDTMSDQEGQSKFDYTVRISMPDGEVLLGCCNARTDADHAEKYGNQGLQALPVADVTTLSADLWPRYLFDMLPAIRACLDRTPGTSKWVTKAWPMNKGMVGVRTGNPHGGKWGCIAEQESGDVDIFKSLPPNVVRLPGEGMIIFTPLDQKPPEGECFEHERVLDNEGKLVGWLSYNTC